MLMFQCQDRFLQHYIFLVNVLLLAQDCFEIFSGRQAKDVVKFLSRLASPSGLLISPQVCFARRTRTVRDNTRNL
jgi:hypothetical protein